MPGSRLGQNYGIFVLENYQYFFLIYRLGALFFMIMNQVLINLAAVDLFIKDKALFV